jgi:hypothetical protein
VLDATRTRSHTLVEDAALEDAVFEAVDCVFAPKPER